MYQTTIQSVNGTTATDSNGKVYYIAGNNPIVAGQQVFTDGQIIYGNTFTGGQSYIPVSNGGILWLIPYKEIQLIDKSLTKIKTLCNTDANFMTYDKKNFNAYVGGHWQKLPAIKDYTVLDACYTKDGDLLEIGYVDKPNYSKGYAGKTEALSVYDESSYVESGPIDLAYAKHTAWYEYQAFYDFTDQTTGKTDFIKLVKNGEIEKSIDTQSLLNSLDSDLKNHAVANMGMQNIYKMYESVSLAKSQMTRNKDGGFTCLLSVSCTYVAYCVKYRDFKELTYTDEHDNFISTDSHHFGKILANQQVLVTEKGTKVINKSYTISGIGKSWGNLYRKSLGDSADWPCYYTIQVTGYGGDIKNATEPQQPPKGLSLWYSWKYNQFWKSWDYQNQKWIITNTPGGHNKAITENKNFTDYTFFAPQFKNEKLDLYSWRLDNGTMLFNEKNYKLTVNGCSFDYWSNIVFDAYPFKKGFLFVVFYMRESKIKLIYWDGKIQKEVASCPYVGVYNRTFRVCEFTNMAKVKNMAGARNG